LETTHKPADLEADIAEAEKAYEETANQEFIASVQAKVEAAKMQLQSIPGHEKNRDIQSALASLGGSVTDLASAQNMLQTAEKASGVAQAEEGAIIQEEVGGLLTGTAAFTALLSSSEGKQAISGLKAL